MYALQSVNGRETFTPLVVIFVSFPTVCKVFVWQAFQVRIFKQIGELSGKLSMLTFEFFFDSNKSSLFASFSSARISTQFRRTPSRAEAMNFNHH